MDWKVRNAQFPGLRFDWIIVRKRDNFTSDSGAARKRIRVVTGKKSGWEGFSSSQSRWAARKIAFTTSSGVSASAEMVTWAVR